jgi:hypothetical protein
MTMMNRRKLLGAAAVSVPLAAAPILASPASASTLTPQAGELYELEKHNCLSFHMVDFVAWNNRKWNMQAYYHASDVVVEMYGKRTTTVEEHIAAMQDVLKQFPAAQIAAHSPVIAQGPWTAMVGHYTPYTTVRVCTVARWQRGQMVEEFLFTNPLSSGQKDPYAKETPYVIITNPDSTLLQDTVDLEPGWTCVIRGEQMFKRSATLTRRQGGKVVEEIRFLEN